MNRAQRRAALKQHRFTNVKTYDITQSTLTVNIANSDEKLTVDLLDPDVLDAIYTMYTKFSNIEESYADLYRAAVADDGIDAKFKLLRTITNDFSELVEIIFGEDSNAGKKLFGHKKAHLVQITEFIEDFEPTAEAIIATTSLALKSIDEPVQQSNVVPMG